MSRNDEEKDEKGNYIRRERSFGSRYAVSHTRIELCTLGYRAGVIGAAMLARE